MTLKRMLITGFVLAGLQLLALTARAAAQDATRTQNPPSGQGPADAQSAPAATSSTQSQTGQQQSSQISADQSSETRAVPAAALSALVGLRSDDASLDTSLELPQIPSVLGGGGMPLGFVTEMERSNYLRAGVNIGAAYDDNPLLSSVSTAGNASVSVFPNVSIQESTTRMRFILGYAGGLTVNQRFTSQDEGSHGLNFDSLFRLSPHVNLRVAENFSLTTGLFDSGVNGGTAAGLGGPNTSVLTPISTQRSSLTTVEANYHVALNDLVGGSGSFYDLRFSNVPSGTTLANSQTQSLMDSQTETADAFWLHKIVGPDWAGLSYRYQRITFDPNGETDVHSLMVIDTLKWRNRFAINGFVGPQYSDSESSASGSMPALSLNQWFVTGGVEASWRTSRTSVTGGYSRGINDGGGILGVVDLQQVHASFGREIAQRWIATLTASHGVNRSIVAVPGELSSINLTTAGATLERNVNKSLGFRMGYMHEFQQQFGVAGPPNASRNQFVVTLSYQWAKPLGM